MDREQLEQEALRQLNKGSMDGALKAYQQILRLDPRDRRIRQKVGELLLRMGQPLEAEKYLREVAESLVKEGQPRAALALLKQLTSVRAEDPALQMLIGECSLASGYAGDARTCFDTAMRLFIGLAKPIDAASAARRIAELAPTEPVHRLKVAELLEQGADTAGALALYLELVEEFRRRGRPDEVGRIAEMALRLKADDLGLLLDAAAARVAAGDGRKALTFLQPAFQQGPREPRTLDLLAGAFESLGQAEKALKVLGELARVSEERGDVATEAGALRRAVRVAPEDASLVARLAAAEQREKRLERRLFHLGVAESQHEDEVVAVVRAEVYGRFGFHDRAVAALEAALAVRPDSLALLASIAEAQAASGRVDQALAAAERMLLRAGSDADAVRERIGIIARARVGSPAAVAAPPAPAAAAPVAAAPAVVPAAPAPLASAAAAPAVTVAPDAPPVPVPSGPETPEARGDRLAASGDLPGAIVAYREALAADPLNDGVLGKIAALRRPSRDAAPAVATPLAPSPLPPAPVPARGQEPGYGGFALDTLDTSTFAEIDPVALDEAGAVGAFDPDEVRALVAVGMHSDALALLEGAEGLEAAVLRALAYKGLGDASTALNLLRDARDDGDDSDPLYAEVMFELAALIAGTGKHRSAMLLLEELRGLFPDFRSTEVDARIRGLARLVK